MRPIITLAALLLLSLTSIVKAQNQQLKFEVATVKLTDPSFPGSSIAIPGETVSARGLTLRDLIAFVYDLDNPRVLAVPKLLESERFDIVGKPTKPGRPTMAEVKVMLQGLLADRFQLKFHKESKVMPIYALIVAKGGHKMKVRTEGDGGAAPSMIFQGTRLPGRYVTMDILVSGLIRIVRDRPIVDKTGLSGAFDFDLVWQPDLQVGKEGIAGANADAPDIFTALQEQLGLKLDAQNGPADVIVIDHAEKPDAN